MKVLIAEDEVELCDVMKSFLEGEKYIVDTYPELSIGYCFEENMPIFSVKK